MIDRSYLPFESARFYQDRQMAKWMGFFLSEHSTALSDDTISHNTRSELSLMDMILYLNQAYCHQIEITINILTDKRTETYHGLVTNISKESVLIQRAKSYKLIHLRDILTISYQENNHD